MEKLIKILVLGLFALQGLWAQGSQKEGYRIQVVVDTVQRRSYVTTTPKEIRFLFGSEIIKRIPIKECLVWEALGGEFIIAPLNYSSAEWTGMIISPTSQYLIKCEDQPNVWKKDENGKWRKVKNAKLKISYINARGEIKWSKEMDISYSMKESDEDEPVPYFIRISRDGSEIVLVKNYEYSYEAGYQSDIIVYDTLGKELISILKTYGIESRNEVKISPDGKLIGAEVWHPEGRHLLFIDVETGRAKIVKAEGEGWGVSTISSISDRPGKIKLILRKGEKNSRYTYRSIYLTFDELPEDFSQIFRQGGKK